MRTELIITAIADDRPAIIDAISSTAAKFDALWLDSSFAELAGKFAGILRIQVEQTKQSQLINELEGLAQHGIIIQVSEGSASTAAGEIIEFNLIANDRVGIVSEISNALGENHYSISAMASMTELAPMSNEKLFKATLAVRLPNNQQIDDLLNLLETLSDDLIVEVLED